MQQHATHGYSVRRTRSATYLVAKRILSSTLVLAAVFPAAAWGPRTHIEIARRLGHGACEDFLAASILPDYSLALRYVGQNYPNVHAIMHSEEFLHALRQVASKAFIAGWEAHLAADRVERAWTREQRARGAPVGAEWPVDTVFRPPSPVFAERHIEWIHHALRRVGSDVDVPGHAILTALYEAYVELLPDAPEHREALEAWYSDYETHIEKSLHAVRQDPGAGNGTHK